jgi:hypothetical protein
VKGDVRPLPAFDAIDTDFFGRTVAGDRPPGPFADLDRVSAARSVDPR